MYKSKPVWITIITLIIGFVLGFLASGRFYHERVRKFERMRMEAGFKERFYERIQPDETQKEKLEPILEEFFVKMGEHRKGIGRLMDSLHQEMRPILTEEQKQRLREMRPRRPRMRKAPREGHREG